MKKMLAVALFLAMVFTMAASMAEENEMKPQLVRFYLTEKVEVWESHDRALERIASYTGYIPKYTLFEHDSWIEIQLLTTKVSGPYSVIRGREFIPAVDESQWMNVFSLNQVPDPDPDAVDADGYIGLDALWDEKHYPKDLEFHDHHGTYVEIVVHSEDDGKYFEVTINSEPDENGDYTISPEDWAQAWYDVHF